MTCLPFDLLCCVVESLEAYRESDVSVYALLTLSESSTLLRQAAIRPAAWEPHYRVRYTHSISKAESGRRAETGSDWRLMYATRRRLDQEALQLLETIMVDQPAQRVVQGRHLATDLGYDVWDALELESLSSVLDEQSGSVISARFRGRSISRPFWIESMRGVISRRHATLTWVRLVDKLDTSLEVTMEEAFSALSGFFGVSEASLSRRLDSLASDCRVYIASQNMESMDTPAVCTAICAFMRSEGLKSVNDSHFHDLFNNFPHYFLFTKKATLPISLVYVFVAIARRLGLDASPLDFPMRVLAHVSSPAHAPHGIIIDVYGSATQPLLSVDTDLPGMLLRAGVDPHPSAITAYTRPATANALLRRAIRNIFQSLRHFHGPALDHVSEVAQRSASYATGVAAALLVNDLGSARHATAMSNLYPLDAYAVIKDVLAAAFEEQEETVIMQLCDAQVREDQEDAETVHPRPHAPNPIRYFVGAVFRHRRFHYVGVVVGWDSTCSQTEAWIRQMDVDSLPRGRNQPFYHVLVISGPERYVAEENIDLIDVDELHIRHFKEETLRLGFFFDDVQLDASGRWRLRPSFDSRSKYPEDDAVGYAWVHEGMLPACPVFDE